MPSTIEYACLDGTPFPVTFAGPDDAARTWHLEQEHSRGPMTPLAEDVDRVGRPGCERAYAEAALPFPSMWRAGPSANGFPYYVRELPSPEEMSELFSGCAVLVERHGGALGIWREFSLPKVRSVCGWLREAPLDVPVARLAEEHAYAQHHTMVSHPSIAAREFGIPCVVGTGRATALIADGVKVTVDGAAGTVTLLG